ncbi:MAG: SIR2 family NAD-dependent protein deacylase, partial [Spirochaetota bacterium]
SNVVEYHGDCRTLVCLKCRKKHPVSEELIKNQPPVCNCGGVLKPNFIFFGEPIPVHVQEQVENTIEQTDAMLVVGTTGEVFPASLIPLHAKERGARIIEVNTKPSNYTGEITDVFLQGKASEVLPQIEDQLA